MTVWVELDYRPLYTSCCNGFFNMLTKLNFPNTRSGNISVLRIYISRSTNDSLFLGRNSTPYGEAEWPISKPRLLLGALNIYTRRPTKEASLAAVLHGGKKTNGLFLYPGRSRAVYQKSSNTYQKLYL